mgnify:CR=1 FL=1
MSFELRFYITADGKDALMGGDKRTQNADIKKAKEHWDDYQKRVKAAGERPH